MAVKIYKRLKEWWREDKEVVPGSTPDKARMRQAFLEKKTRVREDDENFENEEEMEDENSAPEFGEENDLNDEGMVPEDVENPEDIVDDVEGEDSADAIAGQISLTIDGQNYNLVPAEAEGEAGDLGIDTNAEMDDVSQPIEGDDENMSNEITDDEGDEEEKEIVEESFKKRLLKRMEAKVRAERVNTIKEKILARKNAFREEDESFLDGEDAAPAEASGAPVDAVMESIDKKMAKLRRELESLKSAKVSLSEGMGDLDLPMAKDGNLMQKGGPKKAYTPQGAGEDFKKIVGKGEKFAKRGPGTAIKTAYTASNGGDQKPGANQPMAKGGVASSGKAYTPSKSGDAGPSPAKKLEDVKNRILARRMKAIQEKENDLDGMADMGKDLPDEFSDIGDVSLDVAANTDDLQEKLSAIRAKRLARRTEGAVVKNGVSFPNEELKASLESTLEESFDFKKFMKGEY